jgi:hypothetical protein
LLSHRKALDNGGIFLQYFFAVLIWAADGLEGGKLGRDVLGNALSAEGMAAEFAEHDLVLRLEDTAAHSALREGNCLLVGLYHKALLRVLDGLLS